MHTDVDIEGLGNSREPGQASQKSIAAVALGAIVIAVLAFFLGGATLSPVLGDNAAASAPPSLPMLPPEVRVDIAEQVRFRSQVRVYLAQLRSIEHELRGHGERVLGLSELIDQMELLLRSIDPLRSNT